MATLFFGVLMTALAFSLNPILLAWSSQQDRLGLQRQAQHGLERAVRDLRLALAVQNDPKDAIRYTLREGGAVNAYILYLYSVGDIWPPAYGQPRYQVRRTPLIGGINGTFTYGSGTLLMRDVQPPPTSDLSVSGSVATLDLTLARGNETFHLLERTRRRNL